MSVPDDHVRWDEDTTLPVVSDASLPDDVALVMPRGVVVGVEDETPAVVRPRATRQRGAGTARHRSEADIQAAYVARLKHLDGYVIVTTGSRYLPTGTPDTLGCYRGRMVVVEIKRPGERPTGAQLGQLRRWQLAGALVAWIDNERQLDDVLSHVNDLEWVNDLSRPGDGRS